MYESIRDGVVGDSLHYKVILRKLSELGHILICFPFMVKHTVSFYSFLGEKLLIPGKEIRFEQI